MRNSRSGTVLESVVNPNLRAVMPIRSRASGLSDVMYSMSHLVTAGAAFLKTDYVYTMIVKHVLKDLGTSSDGKSSTPLR